MKDKVSFFDAIQALETGKTIHRNIKFTMFFKKIVMIQDGKEEIMYGYKFPDREMRMDPLFKMEDVLAKDWIIEE